MTSNFEKFGAALGKAVKNGTSVEFVGQTRPKPT